MTRNTQISNQDDVIDSRSVIERIEELEAAKEACGDDAMEEWQDEFEAELTALLALQDEAEGCADWKHGETLVRDSYFKEYAQELAEDCGMIPAGLSWPCTCIDWDQAARELRMDYSAVEFDGVTYWVRS